jgi:chromosome segregation ATPase
VTDDDRNAEAIRRYFTDEPEPERPAWLPAKFETPEAFVKSYTELERRLHELAQQRSEALRDVAQREGEIEQLQQALAMLFRERQQADEAASRLLASMPVTNGGFQ